MKTKPGNHKELSVDYIVVGCGLAGIAFVETCLQNGKSCVVFDNNSQTSSTVAAGLYNPVILKRFSGLHNAQLQLDILKHFYKLLEQRIGTKVDFEFPILRKFFSIEEQNNWFVASDKIELQPFLSTNIIKTKFAGIDSPFDFGQVLQTGYVNTALLLACYKNYLASNNQYFSEYFNYGDIVFDNNSVEYQNIFAKHIVFAEGFGLKLNPFFNDLPVDGTKGELLIIKAADLKLDLIVNTSIFILPLGNQLFKVGATYNWFDKTNLPTIEGKTELITRIKEIINCNFEIIDHLAGVRPTVKDRKALIGTHNLYKNCHILNGLGTRGVMLGPAMAKSLFDSIELGTVIDKDINIARFYKNK